MKWIFVFALAVAMPASAQSIYKCRDAKGGAVYQSHPCLEAEKRWDTQPRNYTREDHLCNLFAPPRSSSRGVHCPLSVTL